MANVSYDTLTIEINADSGKASRSITKLSNSLLKLEQTAKNLDWEQLKNAKKYLEDIAKISFDNVSQGLQDVVSAFKSMNKEAEKYGKKGILKDEPYNPNFTMKDQVPSVVKPNWQTIDTYEIPMQNFQEYKNAVERGIDYSNVIDVDFTDITNQFDEMRGKLLQMGFSTEQIENLMSMGQANRNLQEKISLLREIGLSASQAKEALKSVNAEADSGDSDKGGKESDKSMGKLQKLFNSIKRIAFYRLIRRVIQLIAKAIKEGIENIANFDKDFNKSMSNIKSSLTYLKNAIGSAFAPIIQMLEPFITGLIMNFADLFNKIAELASAMQGKDMFIKAKYNAEDFARSLNKVSLGIDELNVIQNTGSFEEVAVSDEAKETAEKIKNIFAEIKKIIEDLKPLFNVIWGSAKDFIMKILPLVKPLLQGIRAVLEPIANLITLLVDKTHETVEDSLAEAVDMVATILKFVGKIVQDLMPLLVPIINIIASLINMINTALENVFKIVKNVFGFLDNLGILHGVLTGISIVLGAIAEAISSLFNLFTAILQVLGDIITGNWDAIGSDWETAMSNITNEWQVDFVGSVASTPTAQGYNNTEVGGTPMTNNGNTQVNVYIDGQEVAKRVNEYNDNRGTNTFRGGTLTYVK